ncbi:MAG: hypothetical protein KQI35_09795 [Bacteroidetes bacterium]|nr:hypothetical protein [Bacteroidota bacterium]
MRKHSIYSLTLFLLVFIFTGVSCTEKEDDDPCDDTVKPEISVSIKATIHVLTKDNEPIPNQQVNLWIYKVPCGAPAKGTFDFSGPTLENGTRSTSVCYYNLRNADDEVWVDAHAVNLGNGSVTADSEYATFKYSDFGITTKEVHVYIYRNF